MDAPTPPDTDRFGLRTRRVSWALGLSLAVHVVSIGSVMHDQPARASAMPTSQPLDLDPTPTPRPFFESTPRPTPPPPTPIPTPPPPRHAPPPPRSPLARVPHRPPALAPRRLAHLNSPRLHEPQQDPATAPREPDAGPDAGPPGRGDGPSPGTAGDGAPSATIATAAPVAATLEPKPSCAVPEAAAHALAVVQPDESDDAKSRGETGSVRVRVTLDAEGMILSVALDTSSGFADLDRAALVAARQSRFAPEIANCLPVGGAYLFVASFEA